MYLKEYIRESNNTDNPGAQLIRLFVSHWKSEFKEKDIEQVILTFKSGRFTPSVVHTHRFIIERHFPFYLEIIFKKGQHIKYRYCDVVLLMRDGTAKSYITMRDQGSHDPGPERDYLL